MNAQTHNFPAPAAPSAADNGRASFASGQSGAVNASATSMKWAALQDAAAAVAALAGIEPERSSPAIRNFPAVIRDAGGWRQEQAERAIDDLASVMEPGLSALLAVNARGIDGSCAAQALWNEFNAARTAILSFVPPSGDMGPRRSA